MDIFQLDLATPFGGHRQNATFIFRISSILLAIAWLHYTVVFFIIFGQDFDTRLISSYLAAPSSEKVAL